MWFGIRLKIMSKKLSPNEKHKTYTADTKFQLKHVPVANFW